MLLRAFFLGVALGATALAAVSCDDVRTMDFANITLPVPDEDDLTFVRGVACSSDSGGFPPCEWEYRTALDLVARPEPDVVIRFLLLDVIHMRGSGSSTWVVGWRCDGGRLVPAFSERDATVVRAFGTDLAVHGRSDELYTWRHGSGAYRLAPISGGDDRVGPDDRVASPPPRPTPATATPAPAEPRRP